MCLLPVYPTVDFVLSCFASSLSHPDLIYFSEIQLLTPLLKSFLHLPFKYQNMVTIPSLWMCVCLPPRQRRRWWGPWRQCRLCRYRALTSRSQRRVTTPNVWSWTGSGRRGPRRKNWRRLKIYFVWILCRAQH